MNSLGRMLHQVGGSNAISVWSWIVAAPISVVAGSRYASAPTTSEFMTWTAILIGINLLLALPLWLAWWLLRHGGLRGALRPVVVLTSFAVLGLLRALLVQAAHEATGIGVASFAERAVISISGSIVVLTVIAVIVDDFRSDAAVVYRLTRARAEMAALAEQESALLDEADRKVLDEVRAALTVELHSAGTDSRRVRELVDSIVRPISHQLAEAGGTDIRIDGGSSVGIGRIGIASTLGRTRAPSPLAVAVIIEVTVLGFVLVTTPPWVAVVNFFVGGALILFAGKGVTALLPSRGPGGVRLLAIAIAYAVVGAAAATGMSVFLTMVTDPFPNYWLGVMVITSATGVAVSLWSAIADGRRARQEAMARALSDEALMIERLRDAVAARRREAARFLHGTVQAELVTAALRGDAPTAVRDSLAGLFDRYGRDEPRPASEQFTGALADWGAVLDLEVDVDSSCLASLDACSDGFDLLMDALSEGLTNVVRHSPDRRALVRVYREAGRWRLMVTSAGTPRGAGGGGIGLAQLRERGAEVDLRISDSATTLTAVV